MLLMQTSSQTAGPYFAYGLTPEQCGYPFRSVFSPDLAQPHAAGTHILIRGHILDGAGQAISDALVEIAHVDAAGKPVLSREQARRGGFLGFGRSTTGVAADHSFSFRTIKPGSASPGEAPHVNVIVMMRGLLVHAFTRFYFDDETDANRRDAVLSSVPENRRTTLIARREAVSGSVSYRFDINMQGPNETVFFDL